MKMRDTDYELIRRKAEMARQLTIVCEEIDKGNLEGLEYCDFPKNIKFQHLENGDLVSDIQFALMGDPKQDTLFTDIVVYQPPGDVGEHRAAKGTLMLGVSGHTIPMIDVDDPDSTEPDLPSNIVVQVLKAFPNLPRLEPLTDDEKTMLNSLDYADRLSEKQYNLQQRLRARARSNR